MNFYTYPLSQPCLVTAKAVTNSHFGGSVHLVLRNNMIIRYVDRAKMFFGRSERLVNDKVSD